MYKSCVGYFNESVPDDTKIFHIEVQIGIYQSDRYQDSWRDFKTKEVKMKDDGRLCDLPEVLRKSFLIEKSASSKDHSFVVLSFSLIAAQLCFLFGLFILFFFPLNNCCA